MKWFLTIFLAIISFTIYGIPPSTSTISDGNWSDASIWSNGIPISNKATFIEHTVILDIDGACKNITINGTLTNLGYVLTSGNFTNNGSFIDNSGRVILKNGAVNGNTDFYNLSSRGASIGTGTTVNVKNLLNLESGQFDVTAGVLILKNNGINNGRVGSSGGNIIGDFIWQKQINRICTGWTMYSFPGVATLNDINLFYTGVAGYTYSNYWPNTYRYDETVTGTSDFGWINYSNGADIVSHGSGIIHYSGAGTRQLSLTTSFTSPLNFILNYTPDTDPSEIGWNVIGNPYPGTIDWDSPAWIKTNISNAIYTWSTCTGEYGSYIDGVGTNGMDNLIPSGESVWVQSITDLPALQGNKSIIVDDDEVMLKADPMNNNNNVFKISFNDDEIAIRLKKGTKNYDSDYDAIKFGNGRLYTTDDLDNKYSINTLPNQSSVIPLWTRGNGTMYFTKEMHKKWKIYLEDTYLGETHEITEEPDYQIIDNSNAYEYRYNLIFGKNEQNAPEVYKDIVIGTGKTKTPEPVYFDMKGSRVSKEKFIQSTGLYIIFDGIEYKKVFKSIK